MWVFKSPSTKYISNKLSLEVYRWLTTKYSPEQQRGSKYGIAFTLWAIMPSSLYLLPHIANSGSPHCCFAIWPSCQVGGSIFSQSAKTFALLPQQNQIAPDYYNQFTGCLPPSFLPSFLPALSLSLSLSLSLLCQSVT